MTRHGHKSSHSQTHAGGTPSHGVQKTDDDRPFAEIRKILHEGLGILTLHRWAFLVPCCLAASTVFVLSLYKARTYSAQASFERRANPVISDLPTNAVTEAYNYFRSTMVRDLKSVECMAEVVENLGLTEDFERNADGTLTAASIKRRDSLARSLAGRLRISPKTVSPHVDLIHITYTGSDPQIGKKLVNEMKKTYIGHTIEWMARYLEDKHEYFSKEADEAMEEVRRTGRKQTDQLLQYPHVNPTDPTTIVTRQAQLEVERRELLLRKREYQAQLAAERQMLVAVGQPFPEDSENVDRGNTIIPAESLSSKARGFSARIDTLVSEIEMLRATRGMTDQHPEIKERLGQLKWLEASYDRQCELDGRQTVTNGSIIASTPRAGTDWTTRRLQQDREKLNIQIAAQESKIREIEISLEANELALSQVRQAKQDVYQKQEEFATMRAEVTKAKNRYNRLDSILSAIGPAIEAIKEDQLLQFVEASPTYGSSKPVSPEAMNIVLLAALAGIGAGAVFVVLAEVFDNVYRSAGQVTRSLGLPILEAIDEIVTAEVRRRGVVQRLVITPLLLGCLVGVTGLTGSMAYLSLERPGTYQKIKSIPARALKLIAGDKETEEVQVTEAGPLTLRLLLLRE